MSGAYATNSPTRSPSIASLRRNRSYSQLAIGAPEIAPRPLAVDEGLWQGVERSRGLKRGRAGDAEDDVVRHFRAEQPFRLVGRAQPTQAPSSRAGRRADARPARARIAAATCAARAAGLAIPGRAATAASIAWEAAHWASRAGCARRAASAAGVGTGIGQPVRCASTASSDHSLTHETVSSTR